jgi:hypothetical protein
VPLQDWIHHLEEGAGAKVLKVAVAILGFVALACLFDCAGLPGFFQRGSDGDGAIGAQSVAGRRVIPRKSIRPLSIYLLRQQAPPGQAAGVLSHPVPDLCTPPAYPVLLAGLMAALPFDFVATNIGNSRRNDGSPSSTRFCFSWRCSCCIALPAEAV